MVQAGFAVVFRGHLRRVLFEVDHDLRPQGRWQCRTWLRGLWFSDGVSDDRSSLKATSFSGLLCFSVVLLSGS